MQDVTIEITEGCTNYSYLIDGVEWTELCDKESEHYNIFLIDDVVDALVYEAQEQYNLPNWIIDLLYDAHLPCCTQDTFVKLVRNNNRTELEDLGHCDECGDDIVRMTLKLNIKE